jgi:LysM repeat protein
MDRGFERVDPAVEAYERDRDERAYSQLTAEDRRYARPAAEDDGYSRIEPDDWEAAEDWGEPIEPRRESRREPRDELRREPRDELRREPRREETRAAARSRNGAPPTNGARSRDGDVYSGYPTAARLLGIEPSETHMPASSGDELAEPGKWQRSERLQSWLEDAEQGARTPRVQTVERDEWSDSFAPVDADLDADALDVARPGELQAGVLPHRASQARRTPMPQPQRIGRQAARRGMPWERRATPETFPVLRPQQEPRGRRMSPVLLAVLALLVAAGVVFAVPSLLAGRPRQAATAPTPTATATVEPSEPAASVAAATPRIYTVAKGDTLRGIAQQFKLTMDELLGANPTITNPSRIKIGQKIVIPFPGATAASATP